MAISISQARGRTDVVQASLHLDGAVVELCAFPEIREEILSIAEPETVLMLGLSRLLAGSEARLQGDPRRLHARFGNLSLRPADVPLEIHVGHGAFDTIRIRFSHERIAPALAGLRIDDALLAACLDIRAPGVEHAMLRLAAELQHPAGDSHEVGEALLALIVLDLARHLRMASATAARRTGGLSARGLRTALALIEQPGVPPAIDAIARACGLSRYHFIRCFRQSTGQSPGAAIRRRQIERAKVLLADHHQSLADIAGALGYAGVPSFTAAFRRETGSPPGAWRAMMR